MERISEHREPHRVTGLMVPYRHLRRIGHDVSRIKGKIRLKEECPRAMSKLFRETIRYKGDKLSVVLCNDAA